ncbi:MAG: diacylglycerol kinase [Candidatus Taylorbacteria bacterium]|nr:diacylglycerol kinase [Candidatus Taylorbacteria bacterium]
MRNFLRSFGWATNGLRIVWREERNFRVDVVVAVVVAIAAYLRDFAPWQWIILVILIGWVLMGEIVNTAIEDICDKIEPQRDPVIGKIKDAMAGYVLVSAISAAIAGVMLFFF